MESRPAWQQGDILRTPDGRVGQCTGEWDYNGEVELKFPGTGCEESFDTLTLARASDEERAAWEAFPTWQQDDILRTPDGQVGQCIRECDSDGKVKLKLPGNGIEWYFDALTLARASDEERAAWEAFPAWQQGDILRTPDGQEGQCTGEWTYDGKVELKLPGSALEEFFDALTLARTSDEEHQSADAKPSDDTRPTTDVKAADVTGASADAKVAAFAKVPDHRKPADNVKAADDVEDEGDAKPEAVMNAATESVRQVMEVCDLEEEAAIQLLQVPCMHAHACMHVSSPDVGHPYMFARRRPQGTQRRRCRRSLQGRMWCSQRKVAWGR